MFYRLCAAVFAVVCLLLPLTAQAQGKSHDVIVNIGGTTLTLPPPAGFEEVSRTAPQLGVLGRQMTASTNTFIALYMPQGFVERFEQGDMSRLDRYMAVQTLKAAEHELFNENDAKAMLANVRREMSAALSSQSYGGTGTSVQTQGGAAPGIFDETPYSVSAVHVVNFNANVKGENRAGQMVTATTFAIVRQKVLNLIIFTPYTSQLDLQWAKDTTTAWVREIQHANAPGKPVTGGIVGPEPRRADTAALDKVVDTTAEPVDISWVFYMIFALVAGFVILIVVVNQMMAKRHEDSEVR